MTHRALPQPARYRGRFAPSPTGPLHFGSLVAALGSFLDAKANGGDWLVRIEDLDPPREIPGAADQILATLDAFGFEWTGPVVHQSTRREAYEAALVALHAIGATYRCGCTRRDIAAAVSRRLGGVSNEYGSDKPHQPVDHEVRELVYPGTCRALLEPPRGAVAERIRVGAATVAFVDALQGRVEQSLTNEVGDFILRRADGLFAYQLAVVVDDAAQGITDIVRGADLLDSTPRQIFLGQMLGYPGIRYLHLPVVVNAAGEKLSKQTRAATVDAGAPSAALAAALRFLGQDLPADAGAWAPHEILTWGTDHWQLAKLPRTRAATASA